MRGTMATTAQVKSLLIGKFSKCPLPLYRIQAGKGVKLRDYDKQMALNRRSFDYTLRDGLIQPMTASEFFEGPNGMSLRPGGPVLGEVIANFRGNVIYCIPEGFEFPDDVILFHEHTDHYSLQTKVPIKPSALEQKFTRIMEQCELLTKDDYYRRFPLK